MATYPNQLNPTNFLYGVFPTPQLVNSQIAGQSILPQIGGGQPSYDNSHVMGSILGSTPKYGAQMFAQPGTPQAQTLQQANVPQMPQPPMMQQGISATTAPQAPNPVAQQNSTPAMGPNPPPSGAQMFNGGARPPPSGAYLLNHTTPQQSVAGLFGRSNGAVR